MDLKRIYEKVISNNVGIEELLSLLVIEAAKYKLLPNLIVTVPELMKIVNRLVDANIILKRGSNYELNYTMYDGSKYCKILDACSSTLSINTVTKRFLSNWRGKMGITKEMKKYPLLDKKAAEKYLYDFIRDNEDIEVDVILKANEEFLENIDKDSMGYLKYAPKCSTFITGNAKNGYLIEYCHNIMERRAHQKTIFRGNDDSYGGFGQDL